MLLLLAGWMMSPAPGAWSLIVGLAIAIPAVAPILERFAHRVQGKVIGWQGAHDELLRATVMIAFLPHQAWLAADAIGKVLYRRFVSRRNLLEWQTAERADAESSTHMSATMRQMTVVSGCSLLLMVLLLIRNEFAPVSMFVALWIFSPALLSWLNDTASKTRNKRLLQENNRLLRGYARQTWRFFDDLVGAGTNWLPPDNSQVALRVEIANRTSPTNIGLWLCSALAARDFGYITCDDLLNRVSKTLDTMNRLQRYEGHLLNWYDTSTAEPLAPRYVSTVDSGNLIASLWVLAQGANDVVRAPILSQTCMRGLSDTLAQLETVRPDDPSLSVPLQTLRKLFRGKVDAFQMVARLRMAMVPAEQLSEACRQAAAIDEGAYWAGRLAEEVHAWNNTVDLYLKWVETLTQLPDFLLQELGEGIVQVRRRVLGGTWSLESLASGGSAAMRQLLSARKTRMHARVENWLGELERDYEQAQRNAAHAVRNWQALSRRSVEFADAMNMRFLFDSRRKLFGIGYLVGGPVQFHSHYDLLASECRVASLVSIAKGDVPLDHWFTLGRPRVWRPDGQTLLSWTGTMFEYLMPLLFTRTFDNSLLDVACRNAVAEQIAWGREKHLPWGVSECAWSALDSNQIYQYHAFGIPALALKPGLDEENVVAPYATMLSLPINPEAAIDNLGRLRKLGLDGPMGFYESVDFTRESTSEGARGVVIYTYMSHHQGMSLMALDNLLHRGVMQRRFHADRRIRAIESLLFERVPSVPLPAEDVRPGLSTPFPVIAEDPAERVWKENTAVPRVHLYGNGRYSLMVTNSGGGYSRWNNFDLTRWRSDPARDNWGSFIYVQDVKARATWSAAWQPTGGNMGASSVRFLPDHTEFHRRALDIETVQAITVASEDDAELRRLTITNWSSRNRELDLTSYVELALAPHAADTAHPAFAKMFIETEYAGDGLLLAHRRLRSPDDPPVWTAHLLTGATGNIQYETDRASFLGRGNTAATPDALRRDLNSSTGTVVDPIFGLRCRVALAPRDRVTVSFITLAADSREQVLALAAKYRRDGAVSQAFELMWTRSQLQFRYLHIGTEHAHRFQEIASYLLYPNPRLRPSDRVARNHLGQSGLWAFGISGDLPILTVTISDERYLNLIREILQAHTYLRLRGLRADLVILNQESPSYDAPLRRHLVRLTEAHSVETGIDKPGGVFLRDWYPMPEDHRNLLLASSSVVLGGNRGSLQQQLAGISEASAAGPRLAGDGSAEEPSLPLPFLELPYFNGQGGFTKDGREYAIYLKPGDNTPAPWVNVMANPGFGAMVSESGLGFTWRGNSQMNRLTPWNNDPVSDEPSEAIYMRDEESGVFWSPTPQPIRENDAYRARHGHGYTVYEHNSHGIGQELTVFVPVNESGSGDPVKIYRLRLRNDSSRTRSLCVTYFASIVMGSVREANQLHVTTSRDVESGALFARQYWSGPYTGHITFAASSPAASSWSGDRTQFLGRNRPGNRPAALDRIRLDNRMGVALDPAVALQVPVTLEQGMETEVVFVLGQTETADEARALLRRCLTPSQVDVLLGATRRWWDSVLGALQVKTPLFSTDLLLNRWLLYQSISCRFWGRSAFYQSSGAMGFRDQLQDSLAFTYAAPQFTRAQILLAASRQFTEGDVQHWWHPETGMGVRTRCSDDLVWLPYAVANYVEITGDQSILSESVAFLEAPVLAPGEQERLSTPSVTPDSAPLWEHCQRALDRAWQTGSHELPLIGNGDWNDGMNHVGAAGRGESVWLAWFLGATLNSFADMTETSGQPGPVAGWREKAARLSKAVERNAWDGEWYLRAFFDDGSPLGSHSSSEARIDSLPQSWAVISGLGDSDRSLRAMEAAQSLLVDPSNQLVRLFTPPFDCSEPHPGYIMGYPPGLRENGGQYTHGSLWMAMAWARLGDGNRAAELLTMMSPVERTRTPEDVARYSGEPYAVAADVSTAPGRVGRAGWTCYTGSAAWMYRIWIEEVLGFKLRGNTLTLKPAIPGAWPGFAITYRYRTAVYEITVERSAASDSAPLRVDGRAIAGEAVLLSDDGQVHHIVVRLPLSSHKAPESIDRELAIGMLR
jgi:cyclic beta-1,2-glucan synthetase